MRDEFSKHRCPGQEWRRLLEAAKMTVSRSFLCLGFVVSQSVIPAELSMCYMRRYSALPQVYVRVYACVCEPNEFMTKKKTKKKKKKMGLREQGRKQRQ